MSLSWLLGVARLFLRSPTDRAALAFGAELAPFLAYVAAYPRLDALEAAGGDLAALVLPPATSPQPATPVPLPPGVDPGLGHGGDTRMRGE